MNRQRLILTEREILRMIERQETVSIEYPRRSLVNVDPEFVQRSFIVLGARDLMRSPLTPAEYLRRPFVRRSRYMLKVLDSRTNKLRQIYLGSTRQYWHPTPLKLGLFCEGRLVHRVLGDFEPTPKDRLALAHVLLKWQDAPLYGHVLGVFADDLRIVVDCGKVLGSPFVDLQLYLSENTAAKEK